MSAPAKCVKCGKRKPMKGWAICDKCVGNRTRATRKTRGLVSSWHASYKEKGAS